MLKQHLECAENAIKGLQVAHLQLKDNLRAKRVAERVDSAIVRLRGRNIPHMVVHSANT